MQAHATVTLAHHGIELRCSAAGLREDRKLTKDDMNRLQDWAARHRKFAQRRHRPCNRRVQPSPVAAGNGAESDLKTGRCRTSSAGVWNLECIDWPPQLTVSPDDGNTIAPFKRMN
jgi:hypothetical protein